MAGETTRLPWMAITKVVCIICVMLLSFWLGEASADCSYNGWNPFVYFQMGQAIKGSPFAALTTGLTELVSHNQRALAAGMVSGIVTIVTAYYRGPFAALKVGLSCLQGVQSTMPSIASNADSASLSFQHQHAVQNSQQAVAHQKVSRTQRMLQCATTPSTSLECYAPEQHHPGMQMLPISKFPENTSSLQTLCYDPVSQMVYLPCGHAQGLRSQRQMPLAIQG